jgi:aspartyl-tRNA(Asn)/glutamyl-tRNA(Gln) amidotransferase subunit A
MDNLASDLRTKTLLEVASLVRLRECSPVELTNAALAWVAATDATLRAFTYVAAEQALQDAKVAEKEVMAGHYRGALHGIPVSFKDLIDTAGMPTEYGSAAYRGRVPTRDAGVVSKLRHAGAVVLGKNTTHELAFDVYCPPTRNPWDVQRIAGGSSGGSAAAVAARQIWGAIGTDTGGSVRIPAAACGVVGLKPTHDAISRTGVHPLSPTLDHVGPICRTADDAAAVFQAASRGSGPVDSYHPFGSSAPLRGLRIGLAQELVSGGIDPEVRQRVEAAWAAMEALGAAVEPVTLPLEAAVKAAVPIELVEAYIANRQLIRTARDKLQPENLAWVMKGRPIPAYRYLDALVERRRIQRVVGRLLNRYHALSLPLLPSPAVEVGVTSITYDDIGVMSVTDDYTRFTYWANLVGLPAVSVPCGFTQRGLPVAFQLLGKNRDEMRLLAIAAAYDKIDSWTAKSPPALQQFAFQA